MYAEKVKRIDRSSPKDEDRMREEVTAGKQRQGKTERQ